MLTIQVVNLIYSIKTHFDKGEGKAACGQAPWSKPVHYFYGTTDEITCERCIQYQKKTAGGTEKTMRYVKGNFCKHEGPVTRVLASNNREVEFLIDTEDWDRVKHFTWGVSVKGYIATVVILDGKHRTIMLHSFLIGRAINGLQIDHWNRNKLDNRKKNLRIVTPSINSINSINRSLRSDNKSGFRGVTYWWGNRSDKWMAEIKIGTERIKLGIYDRLEDAVKARLAAEIKYLGKTIDGGFYVENEPITED